MPFFQLRLKAISGDFPALIDTSTFLYDFNLMYELARLTQDPEWDGYVLDEDAWSRDNRPLRDFERLHIVRLRHGSPLELVAVVTAVTGAVGALWALVQVAERLSNWRLNRDILSLQRDKLRRELASYDQGTAERFKEDNWMDSVDPDALGVVHDTMRRLAVSPLRVTEFDIEVIPELPKPQRRRSSPNRDSPA